MNPEALPNAATGIAFPPDHELCTTNFFELVRMVVPVVTVTSPSVAPAGTVANRKVDPVRVTVVGATPLDLTTDDALNPWPRMPIFEPPLPDVSCNWMNAVWPLVRL